MLLKIQQRISTGGVRRHDWNIGKRKVFVDSGTFAVVFVWVDTAFVRRRERQEQNEHGVGEGMGLGGGGKLGLGSGCFAMKQNGKE